MAKYVLSMDQSTSASKAFLVDANGEIVTSASYKHKQFYPASGYVEHDASEIWENVVRALNDVSVGIDPSDICALSISNQRETTVIWDKATGLPIDKALVWQDTRAQKLCESLSDHAQSIQEKTGLILSPYFSAAKAAWALQHDPDLMARANRGEIAIGTIDSYLVYRLTNGRSFKTDSSNAGRTQLMNLSAQTWDDEICNLFQIPMCCLPEIVDSDACFGETACDSLPHGITITGVMGDSHASLFAQGCLSAGMAKATYGTGSSVMMNIGTMPVYSKGGLSSCVGFAFQGEIHYVLEGNVTCSGDTLVWLSNELNLIDNPKSAEAIANTVSDTEGVYLVPAFAGLGTPHFDSDARAILCGMSRGTTRAHVVRAALESIAFQDADVVRAMQEDSGYKLHELRADGGASRNALLMQFQADLLDCPIQCRKSDALSALGSAYMGGISAGLYPNLNAIPALNNIGSQYKPTMDAKQRSRLFDGWNDAILRARTHN